MIEEYFCSSQRYLILKEMGQHACLQSALLKSTSQLLMLNSYIKLPLLYAASLGLRNYLMQAPLNRRCLCISFKYVSLHLVSAHLSQSKYLP
ncbi:hypothetical protein FGO68_gene9109 [Halteria grandinella]|uniref:Uncharacterized protein n=1 Tax=Halteria grandinella TaxID=5974 RepID=A0A8J8NFJ2_HALGN|nr:hypothetical protein FGO68_gene9109 [Halteria grandinella]